jgi:small conductance mechanosensitive channel
MQMNSEVATITNFKNELMDMAFRFGPRLLTAIAILVVGAYVAGWVSRWAHRVLQRLELEHPVRALLARVLSAVCFVLFVILALQNLGVELLPLIAGLGVVGAGIALATQGVLSNIVAGLTIIFTKPFRVGEYIAIVGVEGVVEGITLFNTTLSHVDRSHVVIPNRKVVGEILHNYGSIRQLDVSVQVAYDSDLNASVALVRDILAANARVLKEPVAYIQPVELGDSAVRIAIKPWVLVADQGAATGEINAALLEAFRARGIVIPYPHHEVRLIGGTG